MKSDEQTYYTAAKYVYENALRDAGQLGNPTATRVRCVVHASRMRWHTDRLDFHTIILAESDELGLARIIYSEVERSWVVMAGSVVTHVSGFGIEDDFDAVLEWIGERSAVFNPPDTES